MVMVSGGQWFLGGILLDSMALRFRLGCADILLYDKCVSEFLFASFNTIVFLTAKLDSDYFTQGWEIRNNDLQRSAGVISLGLRAGLHTGAGSQAGEVAQCLQRRQVPERRLQHHPQHPGDIE